MKITLELNQREIVLQKTVEQKKEKLPPERLPPPRLPDHSERDNDDKQNSLADGRIDCVDDADETKADREEEL